MAFRSVRTFYASLVRRHVGTLSEVERRDLSRFDRWFMTRGWRWLVGACALASLAGLALSRWRERISPLEGMAVANVLLLGILFCAAVTWFGYRKFHSRHTLRTVAETVLGGIVGAAVASMVVSLLQGKGPFGLLTDAALMASVAIGGGIALVVFMAIAFAVAALRHREVVARTAELEGRARQQALSLELAESRLRLLELQIEPHFLFNTLGSAQQLAERGAPDAARLLADLIVFLRAATPAMTQATATIEQEVKLAETYLRIMGKRLGERLQHRVRVDPALAAVRIPPGMVMTLVENAVKHGIEPAPAGGTIEVAAERAARGKLAIVVADTGRGFGATVGQGIGLANLRERLALHFGARAELVLTEAEPHGVVAKLVMPEKGLVPGAGK